MKRQSRFFFKQLPVTSPEDEATGLSWRNIEFTGKVVGSVVAAREAAFEHLRTAASKSTDPKVTEAFGYYDALVAVENFIDKPVKKYEKK